MFPSSGYFKGFVCPFFVSGLCDRPNCHYRHVEEERPSTAESIHLSLNQRQPYYPSLNNAQRHASNSVHGFNHNQNLPINYLADTVPQYIPTPIPLLKQLKLNNGECSEGIASIDTVPQSNVLPEKIVQSSADGIKKVTTNDANKKQATSISEPSKISLPSASSRVASSKSSPVLDTNVKNDSSATKSSGIKRKLDVNCTKKPDKKLKTETVSIKASSKMCNNNLNDKQKVVEINDGRNIECRTREQKNEKNVEIVDSQSKEKKNVADIGNNELNAAEDSCGKKLNASVNKKNNENCKIDSLTNKKNSDGSHKKGLTDKKFNEKKDIKKSSEKHHDEVLSSKRPSSSNKSIVSSSKTVSSTSKKFSSLSSSSTSSSSSSSTAEKAKKNVSQVSSSASFDDDDDDFTDAVQVGNNRTTSCKNKKDKTKFNSSNDLSSKDKISKLSTLSSDSEKKIKHNKSKDIEPVSVKKNDKKRKDESGNAGIPTKMINVDETDDNDNPLKKLDWNKLNKINNDPIIKTCLTILQQALNGDTSKKDQNSCSNKNVASNQVDEQFDEGDADDSVDTDIFKNTTYENNANNNTTTSNNNNINNIINNMNNNTDLPEVLGRKRVAHCSDIEPKKPVKHKLRIGVRPSPQQVMLDRMKYFYDNSCALQNNNSSNNSNNNNYNNEDKFNSSINKVGNNETNKFKSNLNSINYCSKYLNSSNSKETTSNNQGASSSIKTTSATSSSIKTSSVATSATSSVATLSSNSSSRVLVVYGGGVNSPSHNVNNFAFHKTNNNCIKATAKTTAATTTASPHQKIETSVYSVERSNAAVNKGGPVSSKGSIRIAHKPTTQVASLRPPPNAVVTKQALPYELRQSVLNSFIDYCLKIYDNETDAFQRVVVF